MLVSGLPRAEGLKVLSQEIHAANIRAGWWKKDAETGRTLNRNIGELLCLIHSEICEADEGWEADLMDDKLPHRRMVEVELADTTIRALDVLGFYEHPFERMPEPRPLRLPDHCDDWPEWCRLMHRTTSAAMEAFRKGRTGEGCVQLHTLLGVLHFCALTFRMDLSGAIAEKRAFNATRADHRLDNRAAAGGKKF